MPIPAPIKEHFTNIFSNNIQFEVYAHGRLNTIGEHTDYNQGLVMPTLLEAKTTVYAAPNILLKPNTLRVFSTYNSKSIEIISLEEKATHNWTDYIVGSFKEVLTLTKKSLPALDIYIDSDVPQGSGVSSSAALEIAIIRLAEKVLNEDWDPIKIAKMGQRAENNFVGMPCGLMDQMVVSLGKEGALVCIDFFDTENPRYQIMDSFTNAEFVIIPSQVPHRLVDGGYKTRRRQCEDAAKILAIDHLSILSISDLDRALSKVQDPLLQKRLRHIVTENNRVKLALESLKNKKPQTFGEIMYQSHCSQRDDFQVSLPEIDELVKNALNAGAYGARICGGGFGGSIVALIDKDLSHDFIKNINKYYNDKTLVMYK